MDPPLRERLGWKTSIEASTTVPRSRAAMARAAFWFASVGALVAFAAALLPHSPGMDELEVVVAGLGAATIAVIAVIGFDRLPLWAFQVAALAGSAIATVAIHASGANSPFGPLPYVWVTVYAFYFFTLPAALVQMAALGAMFGVELGLRDVAYTPVADWVATIGTLTTIGVLVAIVRDRLTGLISNLSDAARSDPLTGLLNRRGFEEVFDVELERARRTDSSLSVIVGDLDRFKEVNDSFGHAAGDDALRRVGERILMAKRSWDSAARIGGEEFAIVAPETDEHGAYTLAERLRLEIEQTFDPPGTGQLTVSFGIVTFPIHGQTAAALLQAADQALYAAKRLGRNRAVISSAEVPGILRAARDGDEGHVELATLLNLAEALDVRESGSASHSQRVGRYAELIARELGFAPDAVERMRIAGILHDVGRVGVPDELLARRGPLSDAEWEWIRAHPAVGARMLETTDFGDIGEWVLAHHERPDGTGYPNGRSAGEVPLEAAIIGVADAYEAMTAGRPYRAALDPGAAAEELRRGAGRQFDETAVEALLRIV
jgi:diguanylate cyclase (GGDEF)-like protein